MPEVPNRRGHNFKKENPADVLSERFNIKMKRAEFDRLMQVLDDLDRDRSDFCREWIMRGVEAAEWQKQQNELRAAEDALITLRQQADIIGFRDKMTPEQIAARVGVSVEAVRRVLEE